MSTDIHKREVEAEDVKEYDLTIEQSQQEVQYKMAVKLLKILERRGIITNDQYARIDKLNRDSFSPTLSKVYV